MNWYNDTVARQLHVKTRTGTPSRAYRQSWSRGALHRGQRIPDASVVLDETPRPFADLLRRWRGYGGTKAGLFDWLMAARQTGGVAEVRRNGRSYYASKTRIGTV